MGHHGAGRVHDGDLIQAAVCQHFGFLCQLLREKNVSLHHGITAFQACRLDPADTITGACSVAGISSNAQKLQAVLDRQIHVGLGSVFIAHEHTDFGLGKIGLNQLQILHIGAGRNGFICLIGAQSEAVAHLNGSNSS